jgi:hypothetical protein|tara:strand:+ start:127 stop:339 length:213 start_codon:yes stop_codon:yes gene_type:complete
MNNLNTTIDKVAMSKFDKHYYQLSDDKKQLCHDEMVNNPKWLKKDWEDPMWTMGAKWAAGLPIYKTYTNE